MRHLHERIQSNVEFDVSQGSEKAVANESSTNKRQLPLIVTFQAHTHSEKGMYPCIRCGQVFNKRFSLRNHEEYVHGIKYPSRDVNNEEK